MEFYVFQAGISGFSIQGEDWTRVEFDTILLLTCMN